MNTEKQITTLMTERTDEILHMILDLKRDKEVDLYRMQSLILTMYKENIDLVHAVIELERELENRKRKALEVPTFMIKRETQ